ncbi:MAG: glutamate--tRNA ligase [Planctomycetota bacterium]|jgi:glutamyl-tRNA synthetase
MSEVRVRFAPSPTGNVHIGNIRVAIFNKLFAASQGGKFLLRVEDTDKERSTDEAITNLFDAMSWLGLDFAEKPTYQSAQLPRHEEAADRLLNLDYAYKNSDAFPATVLKICKELFDPSFVTEPRDAAEIDLTKSHSIRATLRNLVSINKSGKTGEEFYTPIPWDTIEEDLVFHLENGGTLAGDKAYAAVIEKCGENLSDEESCDMNEVAESRIMKISFKRRYVFFDDIILGRSEKPLDSLKDMIVVRGDGNPVFHLANVVDDASMQITHILRGNDHVENTFRHLFLFKAIGEEPPYYAHFPMIVNEKGKPYSKRDGDAYVGDFREKGFMPEALFNFLALCGWSPGDDREKMEKAEMETAFDLKKVNKSPAQLNLEKLEWLNGKYINDLSDERLLELVEDEIREAGFNPEASDKELLLRLLELEKERIRTLKELVKKISYFFAEKVEPQLEDKKVKKLFKKPEGKMVLRDLLVVFENTADWTEQVLEEVVGKYVEEKELKMGSVAPALRVALTGSTISPGIAETLFVIGKERTLKRISEALESIPDVE